MCHPHWTSQPSGKSISDQSAQLGTNQEISYLRLESDKGHETKCIAGIANFHIYEMNNRQKILVCAFTVGCQRKKNVFIIKQALVLSVLEPMGLF